MTTVTMDDRPVTVPDGATVLTAARQLGIAIPTLCHRDGLEPQTACMACVVRIAGWDRLVPACAITCTEGMVIASETDEAVGAARRRAVELLLGDHLGDCDAPCQLADPLGRHIPRMIRHVAAGDIAAAAATLAAGADGGLPAPDEVDTDRPETACRRGRHDAPVAIGELMHYVVRAAQQRGIAPAPRPAPRRRSVCVHMGRLDADEMAVLLAQANPAGRVVASRAEGYTDAEACAEAARCLHCDCRAAATCALREAAETVGATVPRGAGERRRLEIDAEHPAVIHEPGKCIACGLCVQITAARGEPVGMAFVGRGFGVRVRPAMGRSLAEALTVSTDACVDACPTGALAWR